MEIWKPIIGYEGYYEVSNLGNVRGLDRYVNRGTAPVFVVGIKIKPKEHQGYLEVSLSKDNKRSSYGIHRIVALAFIDNPKNKPQVNHIDGDKTNNQVSNLEWATLSEQQIHAFSIGLQDNKGSKHPKAQLTEQDVIDIRTELENGTLGKDIAKLYNVSVDVISKIKRRVTWSHI
jgi:hypothetical protein